jgi:hypothetical protein
VSEEFARRERKFSLLDAACLQFGRVNAVNPYPDEERLPEPDVGPHIDGVSIHDPLDFGRDRPVEPLGRNALRRAGYGGLVCRNRQQKQRARKPRKAPDSLY